MKTLLVSLLITLNTFAHEGHSVPGAIPPALHGGVIVESTHVHSGSHKHDHGKANKKEIFFEAILKNDVLKIYPTELDPKGYKSFILRDIAEFKKASFKIADARKRKPLNLEFKVVGDHWETSTKGIRARRFLIDFTAIYHGAKYMGQLQVEKK